MAKLIHIKESVDKKVISLDTAGQYVVFFHNISGDIIVELNAPDIEVDIFGLFTGKTGDKFQIGTTQHHKAPRSWSNLLIKGVFDDNSRFDYRGLIRIEKNGQQSHAYQKNQNIILSNKTYVESKPFLEILTNDVFCTHGSTTGRLSKEQMLYVQSRGLSQKEGEQLLIQGFIDEIMDKVRQKVPTFHA